MMVYKKKKKKKKVYFLIEKKKIILTILHLLMVKIKKLFLININIKVTLKNLQKFVNFMIIILLKMS